MFDENSVYTNNPVAGEMRFLADNRTRELSRD